MKVIKRILSWFALCACSVVFTFIAGLFIGMTSRLFQSGTAVVIIVLLTQGVMTLGLFLVLGTMGAIISKGLSEMISPSPHGLRYHLLGGLFVLDFFWCLFTQGLATFWHGIALFVYLAYGISLICLGVQSHHETKRQENERQGNLENSRDR